MSTSSWMEIQKLGRNSIIAELKLSLSRMEMKFQNRVCIFFWGGGKLSPGGLQIDSCNIYGQMYQVGRIIEELSDVCIECKCTEIGVACTNLKC